ncbi:MAG TPA: hypothetical protein VGM54_17740 [Chthoniobacter sp.]|jgi:hypothetical protein
MSARAVYINFFSFLDNTQLLLVGSGLSHGKWNQQPPPIISPKSGLENASWSSLSDGVLTGTQGWVRYFPARLNPPGNTTPPSVPDAETIYIEWDNPYVGSDSFVMSAPYPYILAQGPGGNQGNQDMLNFTLKGASDGPAPGQHTCVEGYVWRGAYPGDFTCVLPAVRQQAASDNAAAASNRVSATNPACHPGRVWREARPGDEVCVLPAVRTATAQQNADANQFWI